MPSTPLRTKDALLLICHASHPPVLLNGEPITPEMCQRACLGHQFAALFPTDCRCGDDANVIKPLDERACNNPCLGDPNHGMCGSICPAEGPAIANVYTKTETASQQPQIETIHTTSTFVLPITLISSEDCTTSDQGPVTEPPAGGLITPVGTAPGIPTTFTFVLSSSPATMTTSSEMPPAPTRLTSSCPDEQSSVTEEPTVAPPITTCDEDSSIPTPSSGVPAPYGTTTASLPVYTSDATTSDATTSEATTLDATTSEATTSEAKPVTSPVPSPQSYSDPYSSQKKQDPAATASSVPDTSQDDPNRSSTSTLWSRPSDVLDPTGQPPVPAQVPGSDSTHSMVPPLATIGGLALIAAIIM
ncbi:Twinfilin-1 [Metarhizium acridum]|nr:Twinfilin-1 [Metarhizium acridum]